MKKINEMLRKNFVFALMAICIAAGTAFAQENPAKAGEAATGVFDSGATGATPPAELKEEALPKGVSHLKFRAGLLSLKAEGASLPEVLKAVSRETGVGLDYPEDLAGQVTLEIKGSWLQDGLIKILEAAKADSYALSFNDSKDVRLTRIAILRSGAPIAQKPANYPPPGLKRRWTDKEAMAYFQTKYGEWLKGESGYEKLPYYVGHPFRQAWGKFPEWVKIETQEDTIRFVQSFIADNPEAFQLGESELRPDMGEWVERSAEIRFEQYYKGIPVEYGYVEFDFGSNKQGMIVFNNIGPAFELSTEPKITAEEALEVAKAHLKDLREKGIKSKDNSPVKFSPSLIIKPNKLAWIFELEDMQYQIDANDGSIIFYSGTITVEE